MTETTRVRALRAVRVAVAGSHFGRELEPGDEAEIATELVDGLVIGGFVEIKTSTEIKTNTETSAASAAPAEAPDAATYSQEPATAKPRRGRKAAGEDDGA